MASNLVPATSPPPAQIYQVPVGPIFNHTFEIQDGMPVDGSRNLSRALSPFVIEILPPLVMGTDPEAEASANTGYVDAFSRGLASVPFVKARDRLQTMSYIGVDKLSSMEAFVSSGQVITDQMVVGDTQKSLKNPYLADARAACDISIQLSKILKTPPLTLLINPESLSLQFTKIQQYSDRSRHGLIFQSFGAEQPKLSVTGRIGAFIAGSPPGTSALASGKTTTPTGVQFASKRNSASWQNLMALFSFYANNGYIYDTLNKSNANYFVGALAIHYDSFSYIGNCNSFGFGYDETNVQGAVSFDLDFTVSMLIDNAQSTGVVRPMRALSDSPVTPGMFGGMAPAGADPTNDLGRLERFDNAHAIRAAASTVRPVNPNVLPVLQQVRQSIIDLPSSTGGFEPTQAVTGRNVVRRATPFIKSR